MSNLLKLFISLPMNGLSNDDILSKIDSIHNLYKDEYELIPTYIHSSPDSSIKAPGLWYLGKSIELMSRADLVFFCKGWESARGCIVEHECAVRYGIKILYEESPIDMGIKPCHSCGSRYLIKCRQYKDHKSFSIKCAACGVESIQCYTEDASIISWNSRPIEDDLIRKISSMES